MDTDPIPIGVTGLPGAMVPAAAYAAFGDPDGVGGILAAATLHPGMRKRQAPVLPPSRAPAWRWPPPSRPAAPSAPRRPGEERVRAQREALQDR